MSASSPVEDVYVALCGAEGVGKTRLVQSLYKKHARSDLEAVKEERKGSDKKPSAAEGDNKKSSAEGESKEEKKKEKSPANKDVIPVPSRFSYNSIDMVRVNTKKDTNPAGSFVLVDSPSNVDSELINGGALFSSDIAIFVVNAADYATHFMQTEEMVGKIGKVGKGQETRPCGEGESARQLLQVFASGLKHTIFLITNIDSLDEKTKKETYQRLVENITGAIHKASKQKVGRRPAADEASNKHVDPTAVESETFVFNGAPKDNQDCPQESYATFVPFSWNEDGASSNAEFSSWYSGPTLLEALDQQRGHWEFEKKKNAKLLEKPGTRTGFRLQTLHAFNLNKSGGVKSERTRSKSPIVEKKEEPKAPVGRGRGGGRGRGRGSGGDSGGSQLLAVKPRPVRGPSPKERYNNGRGDCSGNQGFTYHRGYGRGRGGYRSNERSAVDKFGKIVHPTRENYFADGTEEKDAGTTVVCGRVLSGSLSVGEEVGIGPFPEAHDIPPFKSSKETLMTTKLGKGAGPIVVVVKSIKWFEKDVETATAGQMVGLAFNTADIERGAFRVMPFTDEELIKKMEADAEKKKTEKEAAAAKKAGNKKSSSPPGKKGGKPKKGDDEERKNAVANLTPQQRRRPLDNLKFSKMTRSLRLHKGLTIGRVRDLGLPSQVQQIRLHVLNYAPGGDLKMDRKFLMISGGSNKTQIAIKKIARVFEPKTGRTITNGTIMDTIPPNLAAEVDVVPEGPLYVDSFRTCKYELNGQHLGRVYLLDQHFVVAVAAVLDTTYLWSDTDFFLITMVLRRAFPFELVHKLLGYTSKSALKPFGAHAF